MKSNKKVATKRPAQQHDTLMASTTAKDDLKEAEKLLKQVTKENLHNSKNKEIYQTKLEQAFDYLTNACNKDTQMARAFFLRGKCYYHMGDYQRALYDFSYAIRIEEDRKARDKDGRDKQLMRDLGEYYNFAGVQHFELGQLDEALQHYNLAIDHDSGVGMYYYNRGLVRSRLNDLDQAIESYHRAFKELDEG